MKIDIRGIAEGLRNNIYPPSELSSFIEEIAEERLAICEVCPESSRNKYPDARFLRGYHCTKCGCKLSLKVRSLHSECPMKKWLALTSKEINEQIKQTINGNNT